MSRSLKVRRGFTGERGTSLVEYAIVCVLSLTLLFGIIDFGRALYAYHFISNAARTATRWAAVNGSACSTDSSCTAPVSCTSSGCSTCTSGCAPAGGTDISNYVKSITPPGIDTTQLTVNPGGLPYWPVGTTCTKTDPPTPSGCTPAACSTTHAQGCTVQVQVQYVFNFLVPLVRRSSITMSSTSQMIIAH